MQGYEQLPKKRYGSFFSDHDANGGQHERRLWHNLHNRPACIMAWRSVRPASRHCGYRSGVYDCSVFDTGGCNTAEAMKTLYVWPRINGNDPYLDSASFFRIKGNDARTVAFVEFLTANECNRLF
jgi:hypothetical protein